ncbi:MAG: hypothetical protein V4550_08070 [Gemmatimonadota bacterium]
MTHAAEMSSAERVDEPLRLDASYSVNGKALRRWSSERLTLMPQSDGSTIARFRYDGTTCSNTGRALEFHYEVVVGPRADGYRILEERCAPAPNDEGHRFMCRFRAAPVQLMAAIEHEHPLLRHPLDDVLSWERPDIGAGCYCEGESRDHKWGLVLETIHYALAQQEKVQRAAATTRIDETA